MFPDQENGKPQNRFYGIRENANKKYVGHSAKVIVLVVRLRKKVNPHNMPSVIMLILETYAPDIAQTINVPCSNTIRYVFALTTLHSIQIT